MEKLKLYYESNPPGVGKVAGLKLIRRLEELETDDDQFPQYQIEAIRELIGEYKIASADGGRDNGFVIWGFLLILMKEAYFLWMLRL